MDDSFIVNMILGVHLTGLISFLSMFWLECVKKECKFGICI